MFKNGEEIHHAAYDNQHSSSTGVWVDEDQEICYWLCNNDNANHPGFQLFDGNSPHYVIQDAHANGLKFDGDVLSFGYKKAGDVKIATVWWDGIEFDVFGDGVYDSEITGGTHGVYIDEDYYCGYQYTSPTDVAGMVWTIWSSEPVAIPGVKFLDIDVNHDFSEHDVFYTVGINENTGHAVVYKRDELLYDLGENSYAYKIVAESGDIYTIGRLGGLDSGDRVVWKNGQVLYRHSFEECYSLRSIAVNSNGVYYVGTQLAGSTTHGLVFKDGELLFEPTNGQMEHLVDLYVTQPQCDDNTVRPLPYYEGFEMGATDWTCWSWFCYHDANDGWTRCGERAAGDIGCHPATGSHCAWYRHNHYDDQGWLISPRLHLLPNKAASKLTFKSYDARPQNYTYGEVWISTTDNNPDSFTKLWTQSSASAEWKTIEIDLSAYEGQDIYIAFKYTGLDGHDWLIDDVSITQTPKFTITTAANPASGGTVTGGGEFYEGATCTLEAIPNTGYEFVNWNDGNTENPRDIVVTESATYVANFVPGGSTTYTVNAIVSPSEAGTVNGTGSYTAGATATLTAIPNGGYQFVKWSDNVTDNPRYIQVNENILLTAIFEAVQYTISVSANPAEGGTVTGSGVFSYGQTTTLVAVANPGYTFVAWSDGSTENPHTVTVTGSANYVATFTQGGTNYYTVTAVASPVGSGEVEGTGPYPAGTLITLIAIPSPGFSFLRWDDDVTDNPRTFTLTADVVRIAYFSGMGVGESEGKVIALYPNPATEGLHITGLEADSEVQIYNSLGMLVKTVIVNNDEEINISDLSRGLYVVRCGNTTMCFVK